jgi:hypothetical protein
VSATPAPAPQPVSKDYLIYLKADEGQGRSLMDSSGHGNSCKVFGGSWVASGERSVLHFDGKGLGLIANLSPELRQPATNTYPQPALTLEAWVRPAAGMGHGAIMGYMFSPILSLEAAGKEMYRLRLSLTADGKAVRLSTNPLVKAGQWSHVAATVGADGVMRLYVNGKEEATSTITGKIAYTAYWTMISIGMYGKQYGYPYAGDLAELRWWSRAATAEEMATAAKQAVQ